MSRTRPNFDCFNETVLEAIIPGPGIALKGRGEGGGRAGPKLCIYAPKSSQPGSQPVVVEG